jgi:MHS family proline/betaine transporter-like MFS transporter
MLVALALVVLCTVVTYTTLFMPGFAARQLGLSQAQGFFATLLAGTIQIVLVPIFGALSDTRGRLPIMFTAALAVLLLSYPMFAWLVSTPTLLTLLIVQAVIAVLAAAYLGPLPALMSDMFPTRMRTTGLSVSYSFGVAIFGGFAPFINAWLVEMTGSKVAPSFYLMIAAAISLLGMLAQRRIAR